MLLLRDARSCHIGRPTSITFPAMQRLAERGTDPLPFSRRTLSRDDSPRPEREQAGDDERKHEAAGVDDGERDSRQRERRQQIDGAPDAPGPDRVDEQRARRDGSPSAANVGWRLM